MLITFNYNLSYITFYAFDPNKVCLLIHWHTSLILVVTREEIFAFIIKIISYFLFCTYPMVENNNVANEMCNKTNV